MSKPVIEVENLGKLYRLGHLGAGSLRDEVEALFGLRKHGPGGPPKRSEFWALRNVSFSVEQGEVLGVIGRNGAGKSTLLKLLSRITEPTEGRAILRGRVASLLEVGTGFHPELSGRENIYLNGAVMGMTRQEVSRKFDEIVEFAGVESFLDTPVKRYSSGMYVRLAFAVAAHLEPEILIVDEVLAVGDVEFQRKCLGKMSTVASSGRTVLFVSHNMATISSLCDRTIFLQKGRSRMVGPTKEVVGEYFRDAASARPSGGSLADFPRSGGSMKCIQRVWAENAEGAVSDLLEMGVDCFLVMEVDVPADVHNPGFGFIIETESGQRVFSLSSYDLRRDRLDLSGVVTVRLRIKELPLLPGRHHISTWVIENNHQYVDFVEQCSVFDVEVSDIYGTGILPSTSGAVCFVEGAIEIV